MSPIINLLIIFLLNILSTCLGNLKAVFLSQKAIKPVYITTFLDAIIFSYAFKLIADSSGYGYVISFALGRICGVFLANKIEKKLAIGLLEIDVHQELGSGKILADKLREIGYSVTTTIGYGEYGKQKIILTITLPRKQFQELKEILEEDEKVNMSVKTVSKTYGKIIPKIENSRVYQTT